MTIDLIAPYALTNEPVPRVVDSATGKNFSPDDPIKMGGWPEMPCRNAVRQWTDTYFLSAEEELLVARFCCDDAQIHIKTTQARKSAYVRAARPYPLAVWMMSVLDKEAGYPPPRQQPQPQPQIDRELLRQRNRIAELSGMRGPFAVLLPERLAPFNTQDFAKFLMCAPNESVVLQKIRHYPEVVRAFLEQASTEVTGGDRELPAHRPPEIPFFLLGWANAR